MFRRKLLDPTPTQPLPGEAPAEANEPTHGFFYAAPQALLAFGSDRRIPVAGRPVYSVRKLVGYYLVLPATSRDASDDPNFFAVPDTPDAVLWTRRPEKQTYLYDRPEKVHGTRLGSSIGVVSQTVRLQIGAWLKERS